MPVAIFMSIWSYHVSLLRLGIEFLFSIIFAAYIISMAAHWPCPPFRDDWYGSPLIVLAWILNQLLFMRIRCLASTKLEKFKKKYLLINGTLTMTGQTIGAVLMYILINVNDVFKS